MFKNGHLCYDFLMFTGLIEEQGKIKDINFSSNGMEITIFCNKILSDIKLGASICVNGACQSVVEFGNDYIKIQASNETVKITNFKNLKQNDFVNLERALTLNTRLDGHIVSGHVDCIAKFLQKKDDGFSKEFFFEIQKEFSKYLIYKGSIAINGVSLTIASINNNVFSVELIPTTLKEVNLSNLKTGEIVNIETDLFAKYVEKILNSKDNKSNINYEFLAENGFI
jgi:riboflavin synthase